MFGFAKSILSFMFYIFCFLLGIVAFYAYLTDKDIGEYVTNFIDLVKPVAGMLIDIVVDLAKNLVSYVVDLATSP